MRRIRQIVNYFGLFIDDQEASPYTYDPDTYTVIDATILKEHRDYLKDIVKEENERLTAIESKGSQIAGQTGIIFSLLSLFIPVFIAKISEQAIPLKIMFLVLLIFAFLFYIITIHNAIKNYNIRQFVYSRPSPINVVKYQTNGIDHFLKIEIQDLLYCINKNQDVNNRKANNVIFAFRSFQTANIVTASLGTILCFSLFFIKPKEKEINLKQPIKIEGLDSNLNLIRKELHRKIENS